MNISPYTHIESMNLFESGPDKRQKVFGVHGSRGVNVSVHFAHVVEIAIMSRFQLVVFLQVVVEGIHLEFRLQHFQTPPRKTKTKNLIFSWRKRHRSMGIYEHCIFIRKSGYFDLIDRP